MRKKVVDEEHDERILANVRKKTVDSSEQESCSSIKASIQNLIRNFTAVVFEKDELEVQDMSELKSISPLFAYPNSNSDVEIIF